MNLLIVEGVFFDAVGVVIGDEHLGPLIVEVLELVVDLQPLGIFSFAEIELAQTQQDLLVLRIDVEDLLVLDLLFFVFIELLVETRSLGMNPWIVGGILIDDVLLF